MPVAGIFRLLGCAGWAWLKGLLSAPVCREGAVMFAVSEERTMHLASKRALTQEFPDGIAIAIGHFHSSPSMKNEERHYCHLD